MMTPSIFFSPPPLTHPASAHNYSRACLLYIHTYDPYTVPAYIYIYIYIHITSPAANGPAAFLMRRLRICRSKISIGPSHIVGGGRGPVSNINVRNYSALPVHTSMSGIKSSHDDNSPRVVVLLLASDPIPRPRNFLLSLNPVKRRRRRRLKIRSNKK